MNTEHRQLQQSMTIEDILECNAEWFAANLSCTPTLKHMMLGRNMNNIREVEAEQGVITITFERSCNKGVYEKYKAEYRKTHPNENFLTFSYKADEDAIGLSEYIRTRTKSQARFLRTREEIEWFTNGCLLFVLRARSREKLEANAFKDRCAATVARCGQILEGFRASIPEGVNHSEKNKYNSEEKQSHVVGLYDPFINELKELINREHTHYILPLIPKGLPMPISLMEEEGKSDE